ncbi:hypothetical protein P691DRAFT_839753 [Macrolepiota fuliginosa MF-IS2]|uniref:Uncharacterized protein n=1 Tax=Macrolepiota fuliginosa MF-IS2 TaxID=1400762 RepID=A0A9P5X5U3_9AGAR|nr:hypothetical protein P691DRAFT_839753 [Macrolepiota fuliginosa MF-IS2]
MSSCCKGNPKSTPVDMACPHVHSCINCSAQHTVDNRCCPYWHHHFNCNWIKLRSAQDATTRKAPTSVPTAPPLPFPSLSLTWHPAGLTQTQGVPTLCPLPYSPPSLPSLFPCCPQSLRMMP